MCARVLQCTNSSWTNKIIGAADKAAVQINIGEIDPKTGRFTGASKTYAVSGYVRDHVSSWL